MKKILLLLMALITIYGHSSNITVSGTVSGTWNADTVFVDGDLLVLSGTEVNFQAGTVVLFNGHFKFEIKGRIVAEGTASDPIKFSVTDNSGFNDTTTVQGGWNSLFFEHLPNSADSSLFRYCIFEYGKAVSSDTLHMFGGAVRCYSFSKIEFSNCTFRNNLAYMWGGAVYLKNSDVSFRNCNFSVNVCGKATTPYGYGGALCSVSSSPVVKFCVFDNNRSTGVGGGASFEYSDPDLTHNIFTNNFSGLGGALAFLRSAPEKVVSNNLIAGNSSAFFGGGICVIRNYTVFSNNTITDNSSIYGGGFYCNDSAVPVVYNSVIFGNQAGGPGEEIYIWDVRSAPAFHYCNIRYGRDSIAGSGGMQGYQGIWENNIDTDPGFSMTGEFPYSITSESAMTDAGTPDVSGLQIPYHDLRGKIRIYNERIDIGAYEFSPEQGFQNKFTTEITISPVPAKDFVKISVNTGDFRYSIISSSGIKLKLGQCKSQNLIWNCRDESGSPVPPGCYIIIITSDHQNYCGKILISE